MGYLKVSKLKMPPIDGIIMVVVIYTSHIFSISKNIVCIATFKIAAFPEVHTDQHQ